MRRSRVDALEVEGEELEIVVGPIEEIVVVGAEGLQTDLTRCRRILAPQPLGNGAPACQLDGGQAQPAARSRV